MGMGVPTRTAMTDPLLTLAQWMSPAFPVGAFAYSHGLEQCIADGLVHDAESLTLWLTDIIETGGGQSDVVLLAAAYQSEELERVDATARALCPSTERLLESDLQGSAFCKTVQSVWNIPIDGLIYPIAVGAAARAMDLPLEKAASLYLQALVSNLVSAAIRLIPLGQTEGQRVLLQLTPVIEETALAAIKTSLDRIGSASFAADVASMRHETLQPRIFRT